MPRLYKENLLGFWSRRIDETNRLVYAIDDDYLRIISCRYHYQERSPIARSPSNYFGQNAISLEQTMFPEKLA